MLMLLEGPHISFALILPVVHVMLKMRARKTNYFYFFQGASLQHLWREPDGVRGGPVRAGDDRGGGLPAQQQGSRHPPPQQARQARRQVSVFPYLL